MSTTESMFEFTTEGGVHITRQRFATPYDNAVSAYIDRLDCRRGAVFSSNYEYPGRYTRWDTAIIDPPLGVTSKDRSVTVEAYNERGKMLLDAIASVLRDHDHVERLETHENRIDLQVKQPQGVVPEEMRSRAPTVFSVLRAVVDLFRSDADPNLALYGAFGYDLCFQFDPIELKLNRPDDQRDMVMYLPDEILVVDHHAAEAWHERYEFSIGAASTKGLPREGEDVPFVSAPHDPGRGDHEPGEYARLVKKAKEKFIRGDLFEVVPGQVFTERCENPPSAISRKLKQINPSPYSFFINLGEGEYLVGASPEMFVRVEGRRIETCPISGTIRRGKDPIEDSEQILKLLNSKKDESELTMCSDVDRNDKSRVCEPGSVKVIGRRQIEMYSRLIHTVDHIEGRLREDMDAFDGFLSHAWAVTVTGAPKLWAMRFIE
jgi:anthranilate synthase